MNELRAEHNAARNDQRAELVRIEREREKIIKAIADGVDASLIKDRANAIQKRRTELETLLKNAEDEPVVFHPNMSKRYHAAIRELVATFKDEGSRLQASKILRSLIDKVILTPVAGEKRLSIDLIGDLAGILSIASNRDKEAVRAELSNVNLVQDDDAAGDEVNPGVPGTSSKQGALLAGAILDRNISGDRQPKSQNQRTPLSRGSQNQSGLVAGTRTQRDLPAKEKGPRDEGLLSSFGHAHQVAVVADAGIELNLSMFKIQGTAVSSHFSNFMSRSCWFGERC